MKLLVYGKHYAENNQPELEQIARLLKQHGVTVAIYGPYERQLPQEVVEQLAVVETVDNRIQLSEWSPEMILSLGGDGTILSAALLVKDLGIPILGINMGRLGFLASVEKIKIEQAVHHIVNGSYTTEQRTMLHLETNLPLFGGDRFALNDFTLLKRDLSAMITIHTYVNGEYLTSYWGDGVILATPTGSTAYSLSCGGPIIFPGSGNFVITPVAPHNLSMRPIIISDDSVVSFEIEGRADTYLTTLDSRFETITASHQLAVRKCDYSTVLVHLPDYSFQQTMRNKLTWGRDQRN